jgi:hypothetical protein
MPPSSALFPRPRAHPLPQRLRSPVRLDQQGSFGGTLASAPAPTRRSARPVQSDYTHPNPQATRASEPVGSASLGSQPAHTQARRCPARSQLTRRLAAASGSAHTLGLRARPPPACAPALPVCTTRDACWPPGRAAARLRASTACLHDERCHRHACSPGRTLTRSLARPPTRRLALARCNSADRKSRPPRWPAARPADPTHTTPTPCLACLS